MKKAKSNLKTNILIVVILVLFNTSCAVNGTLQGLYSYYNKTKSTNPKLLIKIDSSKLICSLENDTIPKVYIINGNQLKKCINNSKTLVYIWPPKCKSDVCYPLHIMQRKCDDNGIDLFIVAEYYDSELMQKSYQIKRSIFGIDTKHYKTNLTSKYVAKFNFDLMGKKITDRFVYFENGIFKKSNYSLEAVIN